MSEQGNDYSAESDLPDLVRRAAELAERLGFRNSCAVPYGRLLHVLASRGGRIGEMGTGCGVGTAWMLSGAPPGTEIVTIELDEARAREAAAFFEATPEVTVLQDDSLELAAHGPFDLLFCDARGKRENQDVTVGMARSPGGMIVLDDLTPGRSGPDDVRDWWLHAPDVTAVEIALSEDFAAIVAVRR